jgi:hypothetical protein
VTPVARGYSPDSPDDPHGVAASAEYNQWARGQRRESGTVYSPPARPDDTSGRGVPSNPAIENTGSLTGHILSPQRWTNNSNSNNSTRVVVIFGGVAAAILLVGIIASIVLGDLVKGQPFLETKTVTGASGRGQLWVRLKRRRAGAEAPAEKAPAKKTARKTTRKAVSES